MKRVYLKNPIFLPVLPLPKLPFGMKNAAVINPRYRRILTIHNLKQTIKLHFVFKDN
jgi:hypothetical protein